MSLHILHSNRVENHLRDLASRIATPHPQAGLLDGDTILLDNRVLGSWINLQLAMKNSVAANIRYVQLSDSFWELSRELVSAEIPHQTPMSKIEMTWRLMGLLENTDILDHPNLKPVRVYLSDVEQNNEYTEIKRYQLAASVADLFDQYLVYRPDWINSFWDQDQNIKPPAALSQTALWRDAEAWQKVLWQGLQNQSGMPSGLEHRAAIQQQLLTTLAGDPDTSHLKYHRLFVFGVTSMPDAQLDVLMLLARHIDVHLYLFNPCEFEWFDIRSAREIIKLERRLDIQRRCEQPEYELVNTHQQGDHPELEYIEVGNPLLAGQAGQIKDFIRLIYEKFDRYNEHALIQDDLHFEAPVNETLLGAIQSEVLELNFRGEVAQLAGQSGQAAEIPVQEQEANQPPSIHIHNCHSALREVEVLHDQLLDLFHRDKNLKPRDVVVMMPRVAPYAPYIDVVFKSAARHQQIRYHTSDRTLLEESPLLNSFETLLKLPDSRLPLSEVLGLLEVPAIQRRFGLDRDGYEQLKAWLINAGVRWGQDAGHRHELGLPAYSDFSWEFGLNRLLAGYAMQAADFDGLLNMKAGQDEASAAKILPLDEVEGGSSDILDGFLRFWRILKTQRRQLKQKQAASEWKESLGKLLDAFYAPDDDDWGSLNTMRHGIEELDLASSENWYDGDLSLDVVRSMLQVVMQQLAGGKHPWSEGVKFCSLLPMRGVPFKVVYLLGMNMDDYPRRISQKSFDLMRNDYRPGDRAARTDDRWLFLEALLSARKAFYVSYIGQDMHRNDKREPSVLVSELIDYIRDGYQSDELFDGVELKDNSWLYTRHPLQPFNPSYFQASAAENAERLVSYNQQAYEVARGQLESREHVDSGQSVAHRWQDGHSASQADVSAAGTVIEVNLDDFVRFFTSPWDWYFRKQGISLSRYEDEVDDEELFELQPGLGTWKMLNSLLQQLSRAGLERDGSPDQLRGEISRLIEVQTAAGGWPLGYAGDKQADELYKNNPDYLLALTGKQHQVEDVDVLVDTGLKHGGDGAPMQLRIIGTFRCFDDEFLIQSASKASEKYLLDFYIRLALVCMSKETMPTLGRVFFKTPNVHLPVKGNLNGHPFPFVLNQESLARDGRHQALITTLAELFLSYQSNGLPFIPNLGLKFCLGTTESSKEIKKSWLGSGFGGDNGIKGDLKQRTYFGSQAALHSTVFSDVSNAIWGAVFSWLKPGETYDDE